MPGRDMTPQILEGRCWSSAKILSFLECDGVKKVVLVLLFLSVIFYLGFSYHKENQIVSVGFKYYDLDQVDKDVRDWAVSNSVNGVYLAKKINFKGLETYYVYVNKLPFNGFRMSDDGTKGLELEIKTTSSLTNRSKIYEIITINKKAEYLLLNGERVDTSTLLVISE